MVARSVKDQLMTMSHLLLWCSRLHPILLSGRWRFSGCIPVWSVRQKKERVGRLLQMHANNREEVKEVRAGDIAAMVGLKEAITGDTLCDQKALITLERMEFPEPVISVAVEPKTVADQDKMAQALAKLAREDPSFRVSTNDESGQTIISGMGELHLDIIVDRMQREFSVSANVGKPQVAYRETIRRQVYSSDGWYRAVRSCVVAARTPGAGQRIRICQ